MLLLLPTLIALAVVLLRGGSLRPLADLPLRGGSLLATSLLIQVLVYLPPLRTAPLVLHWGGLIYGVALALAALGALRNWHLGAAARLAILGLGLNILVIGLNGGHMPVNKTAIHAVQGAAKVRELTSQRLYGNTLLADRTTRLPFLSDIIPVQMPGGWGNVYSLGDMLIAAGIAGVLYGASRRLT